MCTLYGYCTIQITPATIPPLSLPPAKNLSSPQTLVKLSVRPPYLPDFDGESIVKSGHFLDSVVALKTERGACVGKKGTHTRGCWEANDVVLNDVIRAHTTNKFCVLLPSRVGLSR